MNGTDLDLIELLTTDGATLMLGEARREVEREERPAREDHLPFARRHSNSFADRPTVPGRT